jgi:hypothetical protein
MRRNPLALAAGTLRGSTLSGGSLGVLGAEGDWWDFTDYSNAATASGSSASTEPPPESPLTGKPCGVNSFYNTSGVCVESAATQSSECPAGMWWDAINNGCVAKCTYGQVLNAATGECETYCPSGQKWVEGKGCISDADFKALAKGYVGCPVDTVFDLATNSCVEKCPTGTTFDKATNTCKKPGGGAIAPKKSPVGPTPAPVKTASWYTNPLVLGGVVVALGVGAVVVAKSRKKHASAY